MSRGYLLVTSFRDSLVSVLIMWAATIFTITFKIARAAMKNPVESLRYE